MKKYLLDLKGLPGSGKSTLGRALAREMRWALIDKDDVKDLIDGHAEEAATLAYQVMFNIARKQLRVGNSVICDSPLTYEQLYRQACQVAEEEGAVLLVVECICPNTAAWRTRIEGRKDLDLPAHHQTDWLRLQQYITSVGNGSAYLISAPRLVLDTTRKLEDLVQEVRSWLDSLDADTGTNRT